MKNILSAFLILLAGTTAFAQGSADQRTTTTRIADLLARMPALNKEEYQTNLQNTTALGEDGLTEMTLMLQPPGAGDNSRLEYALAGYAYYSTQPGNDALRAAATRSFVKALEKTTDKDCKAFIIRQLQVTGKDDAVSALQPYLTDERLSDPAARALVKIHTASAGQALLDALKNTTGATRSTLVQALGDSRFAPAAGAIGALAATDDEKLTKAALYALGRIGDPSSESILANAAAKSGYKYDHTGATQAYTDFIEQLSSNGNQALAEKLALSLHKATPGDDQIAAHTAALKCLVDIRGAGSVPLLTSAMNEKNPQYREAALKYALPFSDKTATDEWLKKLKSENKNKELKKEILTMLGIGRRTDALPAVLQATKDADPGVRLSAIKAAGQIGQEQSIPALVEVLKKNDTADIRAVKKTLLVMKGNGIPDALGNALPSLSGRAKAAVIDVLAARAAESRIDDVLPLVKSSDADVSHAAYAALQSMSTTATLPQLFPLLLNTTDPSSIRQVQQAIVAASAGITDTTQRTDRILSEMKQAPADKQYLFYDVLAGIGSKQALRIVAASFENGNVLSKKAAVSALSNWPNALAIEPLYKIARTAGNDAYFDDAFSGYIHLVSLSSYPADQQLLLLRRAMDIAKTTAQQQSVLEQTAHCKTFIALIFAGSFLDNAALQQQAALDVMNIALSNKSWSGATLRGLLEKTIAVLKGSDAEYQKQGIRKYLAEMPAGEGLVPMFNGTDLSGWKGLVENPIKRARMNPDTLRVAQAKADEEMRKSWFAKDGTLQFSGNGENLCTVKKYGDFEMYVDWKIDPDGDAGIYLRGSPQVQIWDTSRRNVGAEVGSGGLYNNDVHVSKPLVLADNAIGDWNSFHIIMKGDRVTVWLNGVLVVNNIIMDNYWDRKLPIFPEEQIELQAHGRHVAYRDLYIEEIPRPTPYALSDDEKKEGFDLLFDGTNMFKWTGNTTEYTIEDDAIAVHPVGGNHGNLYTKNEYQDFVYRFEFQLTPGANNGIGIRAPLEGDAAYVGMEIQVLDNEADIYRNLHAYQYHGSVYGVIPAKRGYLKPVGEWNTEEITAIGNHIKVILNGTTILDGDITEAINNGTLDKKDHPGLKNVKGHLGFLGHGDVVRFRHMRVKDLTAAAAAPPEKKKKKKK
ncbi:MAG: DUF1080 domain-containing protein [Puia sp.]|nr:DUF1080 domain-containing protein [Puia sp.]